MNYRPSPVLQHLFATIQREHLRHDAEIEAGIAGLEHGDADYRERATTLLDLIERHAAAIAEVWTVREAARELCQDLDLGCLDVPGLDALLDLHEDDEG